MKVVLLAGGFGTRISEYTNLVPKPMIEIGGHPILWHIMNSYSFYSYLDFYVALGYKGEIIKNYFSNFYNLNSNFSVDLSSGKITALRNDSKNWRVTLVDTGTNTMTGGRVKKMKEYVGKKDPFLLSYGDGVSNVNIGSLVDFHKSHGKMVTLTAVRPPARFGELEIKNNQVTSFEEKPQLEQGWINGGFFVIEPEFFDLIDGDTTMMEREPLEKVARLGELMAYKHDGFWQCMDTKRDHELLEKLWEDGSAPWMV